MSLSSGLILERWQVARLRAGPIRIFPDGCQDVIWVHQPGHRPYWKPASLDRQMRILSGAEGATLHGFRLVPGCRLPPALWRALDAEKPDETAAIAGFCQRNPAISDMIEALSALPGSAEALARLLGQGLRSLQRLSRAETGQPPLYWLRLARLRRAFQDAAAGSSLAEAAAGAGYADQAHFTREARWFHGAPPARLLADPEAMSALQSAGL